MLKVGLTGGIGSGKSVVCKIFELLGVPVYYADPVSKNLLVSDKELKNKVIDTFGSNIYNSEGELQKQALADIVFKDKDALASLNSIVHPAVRKHFIDWLENQKQHAYIIQEAAILFESGSYLFFDKIITVTAPEKLRIERVVKRDGASESDVISRIKNQWSDEQRIPKSDFVIINDDENMLITQVLKIHEELIN